MFVLALVLTFASLYFAWCARACIHVSTRRELAPQIHIATCSRYRDEGHQTCHWQNDANDPGVGLKALCLTILYSWHGMYMETRCSLESEGIISY